MGRTARRSAGAVLCVVCLGFAVSDAPDAGGFWPAPAAAQAVDRPGRSEARDAAPGRSGDAPDQSAESTGTDEDASSAATETAADIGDTGSDDADVSATAGDAGGETPDIADTGSATGLAGEAVADTATVATRDAPGRSGSAPGQARDAGGQPAGAAAGAAAAADRATATPGGAAAVGNGAGSAGRSPAAAGQATAGGQPRPAERAPAAVREGAPVPFQFGEPSSAGRSPAAEARARARDAARAATPGPAPQAGAGGASAARAGAAAAAPVAPPEVPRQWNNNSHSPAARARATARAQAAAQTAAQAPGPAPAAAPAPATVPATVPEAASPAQVLSARAAPVEPPQARTARRVVPVATERDSSPTFRQEEITVLGLTPEARNFATALGFRSIASRRSALLGNREVGRLRTPATLSAEAAVVELGRRFPNVTVDLTHLYRPAQAAQRASVRYGHELVGLVAAPGCAIDTRVGLIDTGVAAHASLARIPMVERSFVDRRGASPIHGTAVASLLVGSLPGSAPLTPGSRLFSANVFAAEAGALVGDVTAIVAALDWMYAQNVRVVNLSLIGPANEILEAAVLAAAQRGLILVGAAGNDGPQAGPAYPAGYPAVIAVAAVDARGRPYASSNRGAYIDIAAPGVDIWAAHAAGGEAFWTGTSFAVPFVTAAIAREVADGGVRNINDARGFLAASARDMGAPGRDPIYGHGLLQARGCR